MSNKNRRKRTNSFPPNPPERRLGMPYLRYLEGQHELCQRVLDSIHDAVIITRPDGRLTYMNQAAERLMGKSASELAGLNALAFIRNAENEQIVTDVLERLRILHEVDLDLAFIRNSSRLIPIEAHIALLVIDGEPVRIMATCRDLRQEIAHRQELERQAKTDRLTGCRNRWWFDAEYQRAAQWARASGEWLSLIFVDLDHFKRFNDQSYVFGDQLIQTAATALQLVLRPDDELTRLGGDEFVLLLPGVGPTGAIQIAERLHGCFRSLDLRLPSDQSQSFSLTASVGVSSLKGDDHRLSKILAFAQEAKRLAKEQGRDRICIQPEDGEDRPSVH
jgi:diguanylate cyclase (GGDEF)-like protein/PAS domain S-box-containing protein